jgi:hypothetical protein
MRYLLLILVVAFFLCLSTNAKADTTSDDLLHLTAHAGAAGLIHEWTYGVFRKGLGAPRRALSCRVCIRSKHMNNFQLGDYIRGIRDSEGSIGRIEEITIRRLDDQTQPYVIYRVFGNATEQVIEECDAIKLTEEKE